MSRAHSFQVWPKGLMYRKCELFRLREVVFGTERKPSRAGAFAKLLL